MDDLMRHAAAFVGNLAQRTVSDAEVMDHVEHCTHLMERAYDRFQASQALYPAERERWDWASRDEAVEWRVRRDEALRGVRGSFLTGGRS